MGEFPLFKSGFEQYLTHIGHDMSPKEPRFLYIRMPGAYFRESVSLDALSVCNRGQEKVLVEFGLYDELICAKFKLIPGRDPSKDPFQLVRQNDRRFFGEVSSRGGLEGSEIGFSTLRHGIGTLGTYKLKEVKETSLLFEPSTAFKKEHSFDRLSLYQWIPLWSLWIPGEAGVKGNPAVSGFDGGRSRWLSLKKDHPMFLKDGFWVRFPERSEKVDLTFQLILGKYPH